MRSRTELHNLLKDILQSEHVYFQPPPSIKIDYPCIIYRRDSANTIFADDTPYHYTKRYQIIVIDSDPDSDIPSKVASLPMCVFDRFYTANNLNHDTFKMFF